MPISETDFNLEHLSESDDELKAAIDAAMPAPGEETKQTEAPDPRDQKRWPFHFAWRDSRGKLWDGEFVDRILEIHEHQKVAVLRARLGGGIAFSALDPTIGSLNLAIAHMTFSLEKRPDWAKDLRKLEDMALVMALWEKVSSHEVRYFRYDTAPSEGAEGTA